MSRYCGVIFIFVSVCGVINNVCNSINDYYTIQSNTNCSYHPVVDKSTGELIEFYGYPFEEHKVVTPSGYTLALHRIPNTRKLRKKSNPIFLQHGLYTSSSAFVLLKNDFLAFLLSDLGYDVWMGNSRGNIYSSEHLNLAIDDPSYWNFGLDDTALDDLPFCLNYVASVTQSGNKIIYIGYSLGTSIALMFASEKHEEANNLLQSVILMAPAFTLHNMITPIAKIGAYGNRIYEALIEMELVTLLSRGDIIHKAYKSIWLSSPKLMKICSQRLNAIFGPRTSIPSAMLPVQVSSLFLGDSIRTLKQMTDLISKSFRKLDLGPEFNLRKYGDVLPPEYDLSTIKVPFHVIAAPGDWLTTYKDAQNLYSNLPISARSGFYRVPSVYFNHMDFIMGPTAKDIVYKHILDVLETNNFNTSNNIR